MNEARTILSVLAVVALVAPVGVTDWSQWRHDAEHSGEATSLVPVHAPGVEWEHVADQHPIAPPAVIEVDGHARTVVATYPDDQGEAGSVFLLDEDGTVLWEQTPSPTTTGGFVAAPAIVEDDEGTAVLAAKAEDSTLYRLDLETGEIEASWQMGSANEDLVVSPPTVADVTGDGAPEVVLGGSGSDDDGAVFVLDTGLDEVLFEKELNAPVWSSPLVRDLDDDPAMEIAVSTGVPDAACIVFGTLHPTNDPETGDDEGRLYVFEHQSGSLAPVWETPLEGPTMSSPVSGDLTGDGSSEIVVGSQGPRGGCLEVQNAQTDGYLEAFDASGSRIDALGGSLVLSVTTPLLSDLGNDGTLEVVHGAWNGVRAQSLTSTGFQQTRSFAITADDRHDQDHWVLAAPALVDLDDDGGRDVVGLTLPVDINEQNPAESDVKPGAVFAVSPDASHTLSGVELGPLTADTDGFEPRWVSPTPEDGGLAGPIAADANGDGVGELLAGTGFPVIGDSTTTRVLGNLNPAITEIHVDPAEPTTADEIAFQPTVVDQDHGDDELAYDWDLGDGTTSTDPEPVHSYADDGTYTLALEVSDPDGHAWTHQRTLEVANVPPDVTAAVDTTPDNLTVEAHATADDTDGQIADVRWDLGDGTTVQDTSTTHTYDTGGTYEATFTATDDDGDANATTRTVHVNRFPTLDGPSGTQGTEGQALTLSFPYDDPDGDAVHVAWLDGAPGAETQILDDTVEVTWTPPYDTATRQDTPVTVDLTLAIEDEGQPAGTATHTLPVDVDNTNRAPSIDGPDQAEASGGTTTVIEGSLADPDGNPVDVQATGLPEAASLEIDDDAWRLSVSPSPYTDASTHALELEADDGQDQDSHALTLDIVPNQPPIPAIDGPALVNATTPWNHARAAFDGHAEDPEGHEVTRFTWTMGDIVHQGSSFEHGFREHGTYDVSLEATDEHEASATSTHALAVDDALTGDVLVQPAQAGPTVDRWVDLVIAYDDGTPLATTAVDIEVHHAGLDRTTGSYETTTDADGRARIPLDGDLGLPVFLPGEHVAVVSAQAESLGDAVLQDEETIAMQATFAVTQP